MREHRPSPIVRERSAERRGVTFNAFRRTPNAVGVRLPALHCGDFFHPGAALQEFGGRALPGYSKLFTRLIPGLSSRSSKLPVSPYSHEQTHVVGSDGPAGASPDPCLRDTGAGAASVPPNRRL